MPHGMQLFAKRPEHTFGAAIVEHGDHPRIGDKDIHTLAEQVIYIPNTHPMLVPILAVIPLQLLSYYMAVARGANVDQPRNLAKSVTVE